MNAISRALLRWILLVVAAAIALQLFFLARIALLAFADPESTSFERSEIWRISHAQNPKPVRWRQHWVDYERLPVHIKRAVLAAEDDRFTLHDGIDWEAVNDAWERNARARARTAERGGKPQTTRVYGGSTITQQLAKNLLLSGERSFLRKGQELLLAMMLEALLDKRRILEIYLNHAEWGEGIFGAEAASRRYFDKSASQLDSDEAARLAVMLPRPRYYERNPDSAYLADRAFLISVRLWYTKVP